MPISDQGLVDSTAATNQNVNRANPIPGRPIRTVVRSVTNQGLKDCEVTCSVFYNLPGQGSAGATPGQTNSGQKFLCTAQTLVPSSTHQLAELDFTISNTGSIQDVPMGSRFYMTIKITSHSIAQEGGSDGIGNLTYIVNNLWRWDYSNLGD